MVFSHPGFWVVLHVGQVVGPDASEQSLRPLFQQIFVNGLLCSVVVLFGISRLPGFVLFVGRAMEVYMKRIFQCFLNRCLCKAQH